MEAVERTMRVRICILTMINDDDDDDDDELRLTCHVHENLSKTTLYSAFKWLDMTNRESHEMNGWDYTYHN